MQSIAFAGKVKYFQARRAVQSVLGNVRKHLQLKSAIDAPVVGHSSNLLWIEEHAAQLDYRWTHLVVSQNIQPHLWRLGVMGG